MSLPLGYISQYSSAAGIQSYFDTRFPTTRSSPSTQARILKWNGQPVDPTGFVEIAQITAYDSTKGLYTCVLQGVKVPPPAYTSLTGRTYLAYDHQQLEGNVSLTSPRFLVGNYVQVVKGQGINIIINSQDYPDFYVTNASDSAGPKVAISAGTIQFIGIETQVVVPSVSATAVTDGDKAWVQYDGSNAWSCHVGSAFPTNKIYIALATSISVTGKTVDNIDYAWSGGDIIAPEIFSVTLTGTAGAVGTPPVYDTVTTLGGIELIAAYDIDATSDNGNDNLLAYNAGTKGIAYLLADGSFSFYAFDELPKTKTQKLITSITWTGTELKDTYQNIVVFDTNTTNTDETIDTTTACSSGG